MAVKDLVDRLAALRENADLSQAELAKKVGHSRSSIWKVEDKGRINSLDLLEAWAEACGRALRIDFPLVGSRDADLLEALAALDPDEREALIQTARLLSRLREDLRKSWLRGAKGTVEAWEEILDDLPEPV